MEKVDPNAAANSRSLFETYVKPLLEYEGNPLGAAQMVGQLGAGLGTQAINGLGRLQGQDTNVQPPNLIGEPGARAIRSIAPAYYGAKDSPLGRVTSWLGKKYDQGVQTDADLVSKYLGTPAGGQVAALGSVAPMFLGPGEGKAVEAGAETVASKLPGEAAQVSHTALPPHTVSVEPAGDAYQPTALSVTARHPETGEALGSLVMQPRGGVMTGIRSDVHPALQGQGLGTKLLQRGVDYAHERGMDWGSDTSVTPGQMRTYLKLREKGYGVDVNPNATEWESPDGPALQSADGRPVVNVTRPTPSKQATQTEFPRAMVVPHHTGYGNLVDGRIVSTHPDIEGAQDAVDAVNGGGFSSPTVATDYPNFAEGGEVGTVLGGLGDLIKTYAPLKGMPSKATIPGHGTVDVGPHQPARDAAAAYMKEAGLPYHPPGNYAQVDPARATKIAGAFEAMPHAPDDPAVKASYDAMIRETLAQYQHMKDTGLNVEFIPSDFHHHGPAGSGDPYAASPRLAAEDVKNNNHLWVFPTTGGFGSDAADVTGNPLLRDSGETFGGVPATNNDVFRAVHDYFGHIKEGVGFRANGEENAWRQHAAMYSPEARPAMTTETRGQNSWLNYGPHGETNRTAKSADTVFAPQKTGLLPDEFSQPEDPQLHFLHMSNLSEPQVTLDPAYYGTGIKGAEARRGGPKVTSLYPADIPASKIEQGLESKTPYRVSVPAKSMYNLNEDPQGIRAANPDFSDVESAIRDAGYAGYHVPEGAGLFRGQGRLFHPTPATRLGPGLMPQPEEDLSAGFAEGGEVGTALGGLGEMIARYAPEAEHLSDLVSSKGDVTYNPSSGDIHGTGYAVPTQPGRSVPLDHVPTPEDIHSFLLTHQDAFDEDPQAALHVHSDDKGNHFLHVAHVTPDFGHASDVAAQHGVPGFMDLANGDIHPANHEAATAGVDTSTSPPPEVSLVEKYLSGPARQQTPWTPGQQTVANPKRNAFPGIYGNPRTVIQDASSKVGPEDPLLRQLFGVSRSDLSDLSLSRQGNELGNLPGEKQNPTGAASARDVMTPANEQRLVDVLGEARNSPELYKGMTGWYAMDPLFNRFRQIYGDEEAPGRFEKFITLMGMASPGSDVGTEIARGTSAHWLDTQGRFQDFLKYGGGNMSGMDRQLDRPEDMLQVPGHAYHRTAQGIPMADYLRTGAVQMKSPKVPPYIRASGVPQTGFQTDLPVGDAHWARGVGLADTRGTRTIKGEEVIPGGSVSTPEMQTLAPWWRHRVAGPSGLESVPAQALAWGAFSPYTGIRSAIGAPKLEILATQVGKLADRLGVSPETARDLVITGKAGAYRSGGSVR